jgi:hypothetical protein
MGSVDHAVIANSHTPGIRLAEQLLTSGRVWLTAKRLDFRRDALLKLSRQFLQATQSGGLELNPIGHPKCLH